MFCVKISQKDKPYPICIPTHLMGSFWGEGDDGEHCPFSHISRLIPSFERLCMHTVNHCKNPSSFWLLTSKSSLVINLAIPGTSTLFKIHNPKGKKGSPIFLLLILLFH